MNRNPRRLFLGLGLLAYSPAFGQSTELVSLSTSGVQGDRESVIASMSPDGRFVAFESPSSTLDPNVPVGGLFLRDRQAGTLTIVSVSSTEVPADFGGSYEPSVSADGRYVTFYSFAGNLGVPNAQHIAHVYLRDCVAGTTSCIDVDPLGNPGTWGAATPRISANGRYVTFTSASGELVPGDAFQTTDVFRYDLQADSMECASVDSSGVFGNSPSGGSDISADGRFVVFQSEATNLVPGDANGQQDVFVHDFQTGSTIRVSVSSTGQEAAEPSGDYRSRISGDGSVVVFMSVSKSFWLGDTDGVLDLYAHDIGSGETSLVNRDSSGVQRQYTYRYGISGDGRFIGFTSESTTLVPGDTNAAYDIFVRDLATGITTRESVGGSGSQGNGFSSDPVLSADGRLVVFSSGASNLVAGDLNAKEDVFVHDRAPAAAIPFCLGDGTGTACPCANNGDPNRGCENSASTGGAVLAATGVASLSADTLHVTSYGERPSSFSVLIQGTASVGPLNYGDGLRCVGGMLKRLYTRNASLGVFGGPQGAEPSISARSAALGDPILAGTTRYYQVQYRDPTPAFCPTPTGNTWNASNALSAVWNP